MRLTRPADHGSPPSGPRPAEPGAMTPQNPIFPDSPVTMTAAPSGPVRTGTMGGRSPGGPAPGREPADPASQSH